MAASGSIGASKLIPKSTASVGGLLIRPETYNNIADQLNSLHTSSGSQTQFRRDVVDCVNNTPVQIERFRVVEIGDPLVLPGDQPTDDDYVYNHRFEALETNSNSKKLGITQGIIEVGGEDIKQVLVSGVSTAVITVVDLDHMFAKVNSTAHELESTDTPTSIRILYSGSTGPDIECKVLLSGSGATGSEINYAIMDEDILYGDTKSATKHDGSNSPPTAIIPTETVELTLDWLTREQVSAGKEVGYVESNGILRIILAECEDSEPPDVIDVGNENEPQSVTTTFESITGMTVTYFSGSSIIADSVLKNLVDDLGRVLVDDTNQNLIGSIV